MHHWPLARAPAAMLQHYISQDHRQWPTYNGFKGMA